MTSKHSVQMTEHHGKKPNYSDHNKLKTSDKVPKHLDRTPPEHYAKVKKHSGKMPTKIAGRRDFALLEKYGERILGKQNNDKWKKVIEGISKKQCMLEAVFNTQNSEEHNYLDEKEFKIFKNNWNAICQNDPALSQLLEGLFAAVISTNEAMKKDDKNEVNVQQKALKQSLAYAVFFMTKRGQIPLESPRGKQQNEPKAILIELIDIYNDWQLDDGIGKKSCRKCGKKGKEENGKKEEGKNGQEEQEHKEKGKNGQKERRFLQFFERSLETKWDANIFSSGDRQNEDDDYENNLDDAIGRRRRRRKRMPTNSNHISSTDLLIFFGVLFIVVVILCNFDYCCPRSSVVPSLPRPNVMALVPPLPQEIQMRNANTKVITSTPYDGTEEIECEICLGAIKMIGNEEEGEEVNEVIKLDCNHIFHYECIHLWFENNHNTCPYCRHAHANTVLLNGAINRGNTAQGTAMANPQEWVIDMPSDGQNSGNTVGMGTDGAQTNRHNNDSANEPN
ncbi:hypothetical protein niasHT_005924 [Heterodera trifolii]|uniref:RING-type domain-containing protein n=1 Tax=Heterodera trifolii TaxID=157864 RepID=A0ABD2LT46_9BILA